GRCGAHVTVGERFVGQRVARHEDPRFLTGRGRYVDDIPMPGALHVAFARSDIARGRILSLDTAEAAAMPGVVAIFAAGDLDELFHDHRSNDEIQLQNQRPFRLFAADDVRCVGDPIAMVVADSRYRAEDAVDAIVVEIEPEAAVVDITRALEPDAPIVHPESASNIWQENPPAFPTPELDEVITSAPVSMTETFHQHRYATVPMETRGVLANWEPYGEQLTVWISTQGPHNVRSFLARALALDESQIRVIMPDVGGACGLKMSPAEEEIATVLAARKLGRPVKWIQDRRENLMADEHARDDRATVTIAAEEDGTLLAAKVQFTEGAAHSRPRTPARRSS